MRKTILVLVILGCLLLSTVSTNVRKQNRKSKTRTSIPAYSPVGPELITAPTQVQRINLLKQDSDFIFDFFNPPQGATGIGAAGRLVLASRSTFPALVGNGISLAAGFIGPCGMNSPHVHPRATEFLYSVNGTFRTGFIQENGARKVNNTLYPGQAALFPRGSIHWQANLGCEPVMFIAGLSDEDGGITSVAQNLFKVDDDILKASLGGVEIETIQESLSNLPNGVILGLQSCQKRCGLIKKTPNTNNKGGKQNGGQQNEGQQWGGGIGW